MMGVDPMRLLTKIAIGQPDDCWEWQGGRSDKGYGVIARDGGKTFTGAHRAVYEWAYRVSLLPGTHICHHCDRPSCCNPRHLFAGTHAENMADKMRKGRAAVKLTDDQVREIRKLYTTGNYGQAALGRRFGVDKANIRNIIRRKIWGHIS